MIKKTIQEIEEKYELQFDRILKTIKKDKPKSILLQFPEGLKEYSTAIADELKTLCNKEKLKPKIFIWLGTCFGACDLPPTDKVDLVIQFGHSAWKYK